MATDLELLNKLTESIKGRTLDINEAFLKVSANSDDLIGKLAKLSTTSERLGAAWSVVTRATEAVMPGVSKFLFSARSIAYYAKFAEVSRKAEAKKQKEILDTVKDNLNIQKSAQDLIAQINLARDDGATLIAKENILMNDQVQLLVKLNGEEKGLRKAKAKSLDILEKTYKVEQNLNKEGFKKSFKRGQREGLVRKNRFRIPLDQGVRKKDEALVGQFLQNTFNTKLAKRMRALEKERNEIIRESVKTGEGKSLRDAVLKAGKDREKALYELTSLTDPAAIQEKEEEIAGLQTHLDNQHKALREFMSEQTKLHDEHIDRLDKDIKAQKENARAQREILQRRGYKVKGEGADVRITRRSALGNMIGGGRSARELYGDNASSIASVFENSEFLQGLATPFMPVIKGVKGLVDVAKLVKPALGMLKTFLGQALKFFAGAILAITLIAALYYVLKQKGIIDKVAKFVVDTWPTVRDYLEKVYDRVVKAVKNIIILAGYYYDLITGLFSGNEEKVREAIGNILNWIQKAWINFRDFIMPLLIDSFFKLGDMIETALVNAVEKIKDNLFNRRQGPDIVTTTNEVTSQLHELSEEDRQYVLSGGVEARANGGPVRANTPYIVGEKRPEIFIPSTSGTILPRVGGNTINVHVNGRVGASEQELNELARRIGEKINREMNRFGGLGIRA